MIYNAVIALATIAATIGIIGWALHIIDTALMGDDK